MRPGRGLRVGAVIALAALAGTFVVGVRFHRGDGEKALRAESGGELAEGVGEVFSRGTTVPVEVDTVRRGTLVLEVTATGQTEANRRAALVAPAAGLISSVTVREGDAVRAGQVVVRLDPLEATLAVERAGASLAEAEARYRDLTLFDEEISDSRVRRDRDEGARIRSGLRQAQVALRQAELALARTTIVAPFAGRAAGVRVTAGEHVPAGWDLLTLVELDPIRVEVQVVESELRWLQEGSGAGVHLVAFPDTILHGRIAMIGTIVDPETRTVRVTVVVPNREGAILPGMFARVALEGRAFEDRLLVPKDAVLERDGRALVFIFDPSPDGPRGEGLARWVYVTTTNLADSRYVEIVEAEGSEALEPGSLVLTTGHVTLVHGARVRIDRGPVP